MRTVKLGIVAAALLLGTTALTSPAFANGNDNGPSYNCNGNGSCATTTTTNNYDNDTYTTYNKGGTGIGFGGEGGEGGAGGQGGAGGAGGTGGAGGNATNTNTNQANNTNVNAPVANGGKVEHSGNSYNDNRDYNHIDNTDLNVNLNAQKNTIKDSANNRNYNSDYNKNVNKNTNRQSQDQEQDQEQYQDQYQHQSIKNSGNSTNRNNNDNSNSNNAEQEVNVNTYNERAPVNTAYAAGLAAGEDTCMGSSSLGAQAVSFGVSIGTTWTDDNCRRLKNSRQMVALGYHRAATALMCVDPDVEAAMARAGTPCPGAAATASAPVVYQEAAVPVRQYAAMAPIPDEPTAKKRRARKALAPK